HCCVRTAGGVEFDARCREDGAGVGQGVSVMLRPEAVRLAANGTGAHVARVLDVVFLGESSKVRIELAGGDVVSCIVATSSSGRTIAIGDTVAVAWDSKDALVIDCDA